MNEIIIYSEKYLYINNISYNNNRNNFFVSYMKQIHYIASVCVVFFFLFLN